MGAGEKGRSLPPTGRGIYLKRGGGCCSGTTTSLPERVVASVHGARRRRTCEHYPVGRSSQRALRRSALEGKRKPRGSRLSAPEPGPSRRTRQCGGAPRQRRSAAPAAEPTNRLTSCAGQLTDARGHGSSRVGGGARPNDNKKVLRAASSSRASRRSAARGVAGHAKHGKPLSGLSGGDTVQAHSSSASARRGRARQPPPLVAGAVVVAELDGQARAEEAGCCWPLLASCRRNVLLLGWVAHALAILLVQFIPTRRVCWAFP
jgi:hypothetical protein